MPKKRRESPVDTHSDDRFEIRSFAVDHSHAHIIDSHSHDWHQLIYASRGVMTVNTPTGSWVVPSRRAVWVPAGIEHEIEMSAWVSMRTLYLRTGLSDLLPRDC